MSPLQVLAVGAQPPWLSAFDPRLRLLCALAFALVTVALQQLPILLIMLLLAVTLALLVRLPLRTLLRRLLAFEGFMLLVLLFLPFTVAGESMWQWGPLTASYEGAERALLIAVRANTVVISLLTLVGTLEPEVLGHALARLRVPDKLVHLFLLTARYIGLLLDEYRRLRQAMRARAFVAASNRHSWRSFGWLIGMLLVRSLERSERILAAMKCRGFQGRFYLLDRSHWQTRDSVALLVWLLMLAGLLTLERTL